MRVLSQTEIDNMLANLLSNPSILPGADKNNDNSDKNETDAEKPVSSST